MFVEQVSVKNFRNLDTATVKLGNGINIFYGNNAQGKTNFIESVYLCATGRSQRTNADREMINFENNEAFIHLSVNDNEIKDKISIHLKKEAKKGIAVNGISLKRLGDLFGLLLVVIFSPEDLQFVKSGPSERRRFMDMELCQLNKVYYYELGSYYRVLKQRNNLLKSIQKNKALMDTLSVWDEQLVFHGSKIMALRKDFIEQINIISGDIYSSITENNEKLRIEYKANISEAEFLNKLTRNIERDIFMGSTSCGIHKDDLLVTINAMDVRSYGSQGQQRSASLSAKLAEIKLIEKDKGRLPVLLLDDVLSELDEYRQQFLLSHLSGVQTLITCTGVESVLSKIKEKDAQVFKVDGGVISYL